MCIFLLFFVWGGEGVECAYTTGYVLLLDTSKAFDKVAFNVLFNELRDRAGCPRIMKLLYFMYTNQSGSVK